MTATEALATAYAEATAAHKKAQSTSFRLVNRRNKLFAQMSYSENRQKLDAADAAARQACERTEEAFQAMVTAYYAMHQPVATDTAEATEEAVEITAQPALLDTQLFFAAFTASQGARRLGMAHHADVLLLHARSHRQICPSA